MMPKRIAEFLKSGARIALLLALARILPHTLTNAVQRLQTTDAKLHDNENPGLGQIGGVSLL